MLQLPPDLVRGEYGCMVRRAFSGEEGWEYQSRYFRLNSLDPLAEAAGGRETTLRFIQRTTSGTLLWDAVCLVPRSEAAKSEVLRFLGVGQSSQRAHRAPRGAGLHGAMGIQSGFDGPCPWNEALQEPVCELDPIEVVVPPTPPPGGGDWGWPDPPPGSDDPWPGDPSGGGGGSGGGSPGDDHTIPPPECGPLDAGSPSCPDDQEEPWEEICNPDYDPGCIRRFRSEMTPAEIAALNEIPNILRQNGCGDLADTFALALQHNRVALWDKRTTRMGELLTGYAPENSNNLISLWSGYDSKPGDDVNWVRTAAHEAAHVRYRNIYTHDQIFARANECT